jgi:hypothetical protein
MMIRKVGKQKICPSRGVSSLRMSSIFRCSTWDEDPYGMTKAREVLSN